MPLTPPRRLPPRVQDVQPLHGNLLLQIGRYKAAITDRRQLAQDVLDTFVPIITEVWSGEDPETLLDAYESGLKAAVHTGTRSRRQNARAAMLSAARSAIEEATRHLERATSSDLLDGLFGLASDDLCAYWHAFQRSKYLDMYARARAMETQLVTEDDFHLFRVLGVGGFGSVCAAVKKDTGALLAIKRMDKKLIKHKNRYKSCLTEVTALKAMTSMFVCGLHYTYQTRDDVCLVLDLVQGGTLSYLMQQRKRVSERYVCFFTACIVMAYQALHSQNFVYRDMKPANVLVRDNGYCVLVDFGLAARVDRALKGKCGTRGYWSPEMVKGDQYLYSGDWWSLGVTLVELLTGRKPFKKKFQKYKNTDDKVRICEPGAVEDVIE